MLKIKKGETVVITDGEYSDYQIKAVAVANSDVTADEIVKAALEAGLGVEVSYYNTPYFNPNELLAFLMDREYFTEMTLTELHLTDDLKALLKKEGKGPALYEELE